MMHSAGMAKKKSNLRDENNIKQLTTDLYQLSAVITE